MIQLKQRFYGKATSANRYNHKVLYWCRLFIVSLLFCKGKDTRIPPNIFVINVKMATDQSGETSGETFHDIEVECDDAVQGKLALQ